MKFEDSNWFSKWEDELPSPKELMPISQSLITPDLANAFDITTTTTGGGTATPSLSPEMGSMAAGAGSGSEEPARTLKRPRLVWTPQLHKRFVDAVAHLGIKNAVPKTIMQMMSVDGLTRENVASHLQKYRLYLKRMQGQNGNSSGGGGEGGVRMDAASERLFASAQIPAHFLSPVRGGSEHLVPYVNVSMLPHQQQQQQMFGMQGGQCLRPVGGFRMQNGQFDGCPLPSQGQQGGRIGVGVYSQGMSCVEDLDNGNNNGGRKVLTLFPDN